MRDPQDNDVSPLALADAIGRDPAWGARPIVLYACNTGNTRQGMEPFAQLLADALGVLVLAPDGFGWMPPVESPIRFRVGPIQGGECCEEPMGLESECCKEILRRPHKDLKRDLSNPGQWRVFIPKQHQVAGPGY